MVLGGEPPVIQVVCHPDTDPVGQTWFTVAFSDAPPPEDVVLADVAVAHADCLLDDHPELEQGFALAYGYGGTWSYDANADEWEVLTLEQPES